MIPLSWRLGALGVAVALAVALWAGWSHMSRQVAEANARAVAAENAASLATAQVQIVDRYHTKTETIIKDAEDDADAVAAIPSDPLPPDVLAEWRSSLGRMRERSPTPDDTGSAKPAE